MSAATRPGGSCTLERSWSDERADRWWSTHHPLSASHADEPQADRRPGDTLLEDNGDEPVALATPERRPGPKRPKKRGKKPKKGGKKPKKKKGKRPKN